MLARHDFALPFGVILLTLSRHDPGMCAIERYCPRVHAVGGPCDVESWATPVFYAALLLEPGTTTYGSLRVFLLLPHRDRAAGGRMGQETPDKHYTTCKQGTLTCMATLRLG